MATTLDFEIFARDRGASGTFDRFGRSVDRTGGRLRSFGKISAGFVGGLLGGVAAYKAIGFLHDSVDAASDLAESTNKVSQIFGKADKEIFEFSAHAAKALGQSNLEARNAAASFGIFGKSAKLQGHELAKFSTGMTTLAGDLASFHNTSPEEAIEAIGAALRGEAEPIRKYGVLLDDATLRQRALKLGLVDTTKNALTPQQRVLAAHAEILAQTSDAQGDFARTSDGLANQQRILSARIENTKGKIGRALLPIMNDAVHFLNKEGLPAFNRFSRWFTKEGIPAAKDLGDKLKPVAESVLPALGDALESAKDIGEDLLPVVKGIADAFTGMPKELRTGLLAAAGVGVVGKKLGFSGGLKGMFGLGPKGLLGGISKSAPMPVFVTNPGFGTGTPGATPGAGAKPKSGFNSLGLSAPMIALGFGAATAGTSQPDVMFGGDLAKAAKFAAALEDIAKKQTGIDDLADAMVALDKKTATLAASKPDAAFRKIQNWADQSGLSIEDMAAALPETSNKLGDMGKRADAAAQKSAGSFLKLLGVFDPINAKVKGSGDKVRAFGKINAKAHVDVETAAAEAKVDRLAAKLAHLVAMNTPFVGGGSSSGGSTRTPKDRSANPRSTYDDVRDGVRDALSGGLKVSGDDGMRRAYLRTGARF